MTPEAVYVGVGAWLAVQRRRKRRRLRQDTIEAIESVARAAGGSEGGGGPGGGDDSPGGAGSDAGAFTTYGAPYTGGEGGGGGDPGPDGEGGGSGGGGGDDGGGIIATPVLLVDYVTGPDLEEVPTIDALIDPGPAMLAAAAGLPLSSVSEPTPIGGGPSAWSDNFDDGVVDVANYNYLGTWSESVVAGEFGPTAAGAGSAGNWNSAAIYNVEAFDDVDVAAKLANGINSGWSVLLCVDDPVNPQNGYAAKFRTLNVTFAKIVGGKATNLGTVISAPSIGDVCSVRKVGTGFSLRRNGVEVLAVTDATFSSGYVGMGVGSMSTITRFDDFTVTPL